MLQSCGAALAGLFLTLGFVLFAMHPVGAAGIDLLLLRPPEASDCGDGRLIVAHWEQDGSVWLNEDKYTSKEVPMALARAMESRAERAVTVLPGQDTPVQQVAEVTDAMYHNSEDLHIGVVTSSQYRASFVTEYGFRHSTIGCMVFPNEKLVLR